MISSHAKTVCEDEIFECMTSMHARTVCENEVFG